MTKFTEAHPYVNDKLVTREHRLVTPAPGDLCKAKHRTRDDEWYCNKAATIVIQVKTMVGDRLVNTSYVFACAHEHLNHRWRRMYNWLCPYDPDAFLPREMTIFE